MPDAGPTHASVPDAGAAVPDAGACLTPALQPGVCVPPRVTGIVAFSWLRAHGVADVRPTLVFMRCREISFGPAHELTLECADEQAVPLSPGHREDGPAENRTDLVLVTARGARAVELVRLPLSFGDMNSSDDLLYSARYTLDAANGTLDLLAAPGECAAARAAVGPYWDGRAAAMATADDDDFKRQVLASFKLQRGADVARIDATCRAAGHYALGAGGKLVKSK